VSVRAVHPLAQRATPEAVRATLLAVADPRLRGWDAPQITRTRTTARRR
jgi:hypothetical protein